MHSTSGCTSASHASTRGKRCFSELTFHVAMRTRPTLRNRADPSGQRRPCTATCQGRPPIGPPSEQDYLLAALLVVFLAARFAGAFLAAVFFAAVFLAGARLAGAFFFAAAFRAGAFLAGAFFLAAAFLAAGATSASSACWLCSLPTARGAVALAARMPLSVFG